MESSWLVFILQRMSIQAMLICIIFQVFTIKNIKILVSQSGMTYKILLKKWYNLWLYSGTLH